MKPRDPRLEALERQALASLQRNELSNAQALFTELVEADPDDARAQFLLGIVHARQGRLPESEDCLRRAAAIDPGMADAWLKLGQLCVLQQRHAEAEAHLLHTLELKPGMLDAREALGRAYVALGRNEAAIEQFRMVLGEAPKRLGSLDGLAAALRQAGRFTAAWQACAQAVTLSPNDATLRVNLAHICFDMGGLEEALQNYRAARALAPEYLPAIHGEAETLERMGRPDEAMACLQPLLPRLDSDPEVLLLYAKIRAYMKRYDGLVERLEKALDDPSLHFMTRERIEFLLGDLYDRQRQYDTAFAHYRAANESIWRRLGDARLQDPIDDIIANFATLETGGPAVAGPGDVTPIFIVGMPRSGTSLVEQILASHPLVHGAGELSHISVIADELGYGARPFDVDTATLQAYARRALDGLKRIAGGAPAITDKMPQNILYLGLIRRLFPGAPVIHTRRDPLDTCLSCYFQNFAGQYRFSYDLARLGEYYRRYERLMAHWQDIGVGILDVRYEELVGDLEGVSRRMVAWCGLEWDDACLRFHENPRLTATASYNQVNQPIFSSSIGRWKHYEKHLAALRHALNQSGSE